MQYYGLRRDLLKKDIHELNWWRDALRAAVNPCMRHVPIPANPSAAKLMATQSSACRKSIWCCCQPHCVYLIVISIDALQRGTWFRFCNNSSIVCINGCYIQNIQIHGARLLATTRQSWCYRTVAQLIRTSYVLWRVMSIDTCPVSPCMSPQNHGTTIPNSDVRVKVTNVFIEFMYNFVVLRLLLLVSIHPRPYFKKKPITSRLKDFVAWTLRYFCFCSPHMLPHCYIR